MKHRKIGLVAALALALAIPAASQSPLVPLVQEVHPNDLIQIIPQGIPRADSVFATVQQFTGLLGPIPDRTVLGNVSGFVAPPVPLNPTQLTTLVNVFNVTESGAVPAPGTLNNYFLRDDGVFAPVSGGGGVSSVTIGVTSPITRTGTCTITTTGTCTIGIAGAINTVLTGTGSGALFSPQPTLGQNSGTGGQVTLNGSTSGSSTIRVAAAAGTGTIFQLPATNGTAAQCLVTDGSGNTSWSSVCTGGGGGSVSVTAADQNIVIDPTPGLTTFTVGTGNNLIHIDSVTSEVASSLFLQNPNAPYLDVETVPNVTMRGGNSTDPAGFGAPAFVFGGSGASSTGATPGGTPGGVTIQSGSGGFTTGAALGGAGGLTQVLGGAGGAANALSGGTGGVGGDLVLAGGAAGSGNGSSTGGAGGNAILTAGAGGDTGSGTAGRGGDLTLGAGIGGNGDAALNGNLFLVRLPTADPSVSGAFWLDSGALRISGSAPFNQAIAYAMVDKGTVGSGTVTFAANFAKQRLQVSGNLTIATSTWPSSGTYGEIEIQLVNGGSATVTWPTVTWMVGDGTSSGTFAAMGVTLQASGTNWVNLWSTDGGTTVYGRAM